MENNSNAFLEEYDAAKAGNAEYVYLVDFQEIYTYAAPFFDNPNFYSELPEQPQLSNYVSVAELFDGMEEQFALPLGTLAELSKFLQHLRVNIEYLSAATHSVDADEAIGNLVNFFEAEQFFGSRGEAGVLELSNKGEYSNLSLVSVQEEALRILSNYESGLNKILYILTHKNMLNLTELVSSHPFTLPEETYRSVKAGIRAVRHGGRKFSNIVDAFNLSFTIALNDHLHDRYRGKHLERPILFKLLTNTEALFRLRNYGALALQMKYMDFFGSEVELLDSYERLLAKRLWGKLLADRGIRYLRTFTRLINTTRLAISSLGDLAEEYRIEPRELFHRLMSPKDKEDRRLIVDSHPYIEQIREFFEIDTRISNDLLFRENRRNLLASSEARPHIDLPQLASARVSALKGQMQSIDRVMQGMDTLGFKLTPLQKGDDSQSWVNPVVSLDTLGFRVDTMQDGEIVRWEVVEKRNKGVVLRIEFNQNTGYWSFSWSSQRSLSQTLEILREAILSLPQSAHNLKIMMMDAYRKEWTVETNARQLLQLEYDPERVIFFRSDFGVHAFVTELFTMSADIDLESGLISADLNLDLAGRLFFQLSNYEENSLFRRLLAEEVWKLFHRYAEPT